MEAKIIIQERKAIRYALGSVKSQPDAGFTQPEAHLIVSF